MNRIPSPHAHSLITHVKSYLLSCVQGWLFSAVQNKSQCVRVTLCIPPRQNKGAPLQRAHCRAGVLGLPHCGIPHLVKPLHDNRMSLILQLRIFISSHKAPYIRNLSEEKNSTKSFITESIFPQENTILNVFYAYCECCKGPELF